MLKDRMVIVVWLLLVVLGLGACATAPTSAEIASADYGAYPSNYEDLVKAHMARVLKDPESARFEFLKGPSQCWVTGFSGGARFGFGVCAYVNAKNSFGGYTGNELYFFLINNGVVVQMDGGDGEWGRIKAEKYCTGLP